MLSTVQNYNIFQNLVRRSPETAVFSRAVEIIKVCKADIQTSSTLTDQSIAVFHTAVVTVWHRWGIEKTVVDL